MNSVDVRISIASVRISVIRIPSKISSIWKLRKNKCLALKFPCVIPETLKSVAAAVKQILKRDNFEKREKEHFVK
jgi:hypothetical protein